MTAKAETREARKEPAPAAGVMGDVQALREEVVRLSVKVEELGAATRAQPQFSRDDQMFLIWTLGFVAGAHLDRDGGKNERIFAWARGLQERMFDAGGNAS